MVMFKAADAKVQVQTDSVRSQAAVVLDSA